VSFSQRIEADHWLFDDGVALIADAAKVCQSEPTTAMTQAQISAFIELRLRPLRTRAGAMAGAECFIMQIDVMPPAFAGSVPTAFEVG
jgi:phage tail sheath protein FI